MGLYIHPALRVEEEGVSANLPRNASWSFAQSKLRKGERLAAMANRPHGRVALLVQDQPDFDHAQAAGGDFYIIDDALASQAV